MRMHPTVGSGLPPDDDSWVIVEGRQLVVSRSWGTNAPGQSIGVHVNALPHEPIPGEFRFEITLHATDLTGEPRRRLEQTTVAMAIPSTATDIFQAHLPNAAPAYYCLAVTVRGSGIDRQLSSYLTVPEQRLEVSIAPIRPVARAGEKLPFTLTNEGPTSIFYGAAYGLERSTADGWRKCNVERAWDLMGYFIDPGSQVEYAASIPRDAPAGRYRVTKDVGGIGTNLERTLSFEFDVLA